MLAPTAFLGCGGNTQHSALCTQHLKSAMLAPTGWWEDFLIPGWFENFFLTFVLGCAKFGGVTGCEEDMHPLGNAQRRAGWCEAPQLPLDDTTSEPFAGNGKPGAPVKASMSDSHPAVTRVEPWNTFRIPPLIFVRGWVFFIPFSPI